MNYFVGTIETERHSLSALCCGKAAKAALSTTQDARATLIFAFGEDLLCHGEVRGAELFINLDRVPGVG
jgi:hypothetical protein